MTFGLNPLPQILPALLIERKSVPIEIPAAVIQTSIPAFTQSGTGMVRMWPPLPARSAMTQCSSLCLCLQRAMQSIPLGGDRNPAEWPMWHSLAYLEGLYRLASTISACLVLSLATDLGPAVAINFGPPVAVR